MRNIIVTFALILLGLGAFAQTPVYKTATAALNGNNALLRSGTDTYNLRDTLSNYQKLPNTKVTGCTITVIGDSILVSAGSWRINGSVYSKATSTLFPNIPYSPNGTQRYITLIGTTSGTIDTLGGVADSIAVYPTVSANQANIGSVVVGSGAIGQPIVPEPEETITGGVITSLPTIGFNPGSNITAAQFIQNTFYQSQAPTFSLSGGQTLEFRASGTTTFTLNYTAGRLAGTQPLSTIVVAGSSKSFSQPSAPGTVSGTHDVSVTNNTNQTFSGTVTTVDSKTASTSTTFTFQKRRYWGRSASASPDETIIEAVAGGGSELSTDTRAKSGFSISASGSNYVYYAYPSSYGLLTSITVGGFDSFNAFTITSVSVTNSLGYEEVYYVYTSNNTFSANTPSIIVQ